MGGKSSPPPPDYSAMAAASKQAAATAERLGNRQLAFAQKQYNNFKPYTDQIMQNQIAAQKQQMADAQKTSAHLDQFRAMETGLVSDANSFNTAAYRNQLAQKASAAAGRAFGVTEAMNTRAMAAMGVNPNSGKAMALRKSTGLTQAASRAQSMTSARQTAEQMGWARRMDASGLGRGLAGASSAAYGSATASGSAGARTGTVAAQQMMGGLQAGAGTIMQGQGMNVQGQGNILSAQTSVYNTAQNQPDAFGTVLGIGGQLGAAYLGASDRRLKQDIERVGTDDHTNLPMYEFAYKVEPGRRFRGVMADDVEKAYPAAVTASADGYKLVNYGMLGISMVEV